MRKLFGTDGIRGVAGEYPLDKKTVLRSTWGLLSQYPRSSMVERLFPGDLGYQTRYGHPHASHGDRPN